MLRRHLAEHEADRLGDILGAVGVLVVVDALLVAVVDADHQREVLRGIAVERTVAKAPQEVLDAVAADAHVERLRVVGVPVEAQVRIAVPEVGDRVAEQDDVELLTLALRDVFVEVPDMIVVRALLRRARLRRLVRTGDLYVDRVGRERAERHGREN